MIPSYEPIYEKDKRRNSHGGVKIAIVVFALAIVAGGFIYGYRARAHHSDGGENGVGVIRPVSDSQAAFAGNEAKNETSSLDKAKTTTVPKPVSTSPYLSITASSSGAVLGASIAATDTIAGATIASAATSSSSTADGASDDGVDCL